MILSYFMLKFIHCLFQLIIFFSFVKQLYSQSLYCFLRIFSLFISDFELLLMLFKLSFNRFKL